MRIISETTLKRFWARHSDARQDLQGWVDIVRNANWRRFEDVRRNFKDPDQTRDTRSGKPLVIFNIAWNRYRLVTSIHYNRQIIHTLRIMTHKEYDRETWKDQL